MKLPAAKTLATYGLTLDEWLEYLGLISLLGQPAGLRAIEGLKAPCVICEKMFDQFVVDHQHVRGWKTMPPEERRKYVRGVICRGCNYFVLTRQVSALEHENAAKYLYEFERRRPK